MDDQVAKTSFLGKQNLVKTTKVYISRVWSVVCGGAVVRALTLDSQSCEFESQWVNRLATLCKLLT